VEVVTPTSLCSMRTGLGPAPSRGLLDRMRASSKYRALPPPHEITDCYVIPSTKRSASVTWPTDCGDERCPLCSEIIALRKEREHDRKVRDTILLRDRVGEWLGEIYGTGEERTFDAKPEPWKRPSRAKGRETKRVSRPITSDEKRKLVWVALQEHELLPTYLDDDGQGRSEWALSVWLELEQPSVLVARREKRMPLARRIERAINRAQGASQRARKKAWLDKAIYVVDTSGRKATCENDTDADAN
jgi:hypothetical protein